MEFVSWDDDIPNIWKNNPFMFQTTNQANVIGLKNLKKKTENQQPRCCSWACSIAARLPLLQRLRRRMENSVSIGK
jgi:hypothetical protein